MLDISYDFVIDLVNKYVNPFDVILLRLTSKNLKYYKILPEHNFIRNIIGNSGIKNFYKDPIDSYKISISLYQNFNNTKYDDLKEIIENNLLYSLNIIYYDNNSQSIFYNNDFHLLYRIFSNIDLNEFKSLSLNLTDLFRFSKSLENIIFINDDNCIKIDTLLIDFTNSEIKDLAILGNIIKNRYLKVDNIIIDNIQLNIDEINTYLFLNIYYNIYYNYLNNYFDNEYVENGIAISPNTLNYCHNFRYNPDMYPLLKTSCYNINLYFYDKPDYNFNDNYNNYNNLDNYYVLDNYVQYQNLQNIII